MQNNIITGKGAVEKIVQGIKIATNAIRLSYGPKGANALIEDWRYPFHMSANDAQTIVQALWVEDKYARIGLNIIKELCDNADKKSGDGRKTTAIIAESILNLGLDSDHDLLTLKRELDEMLPELEQAIDSQKQSINIDGVEKVASIAGESKEIGKIVGDIYKQIGKEGIIHLEASNTYETSYKLINGVRFEYTGFLSPAMVHDEQAEKEGKTPNQAVYENPLILVTRRKINSIKDIDPLLQTLTRMDKKDLVIFTDDMDANVAQMLVSLHVSKVMNILIIKSPVIFKNYVFEDFAKITGSTIVEDANGLTFKNLQIAHLGTCGKIIVDKNECIVLNGADITEHLNNLANEGTDDSKRRLAWLQTKTAILKIGANSEVELSWKRLKTADAISSSRLALLDGVVEGAGMSLIKVSDSIIPDNKAKEILKEALKAPIEQLIVNGLSEDTPLDASIVVKNAIRNAIGIIGIVLTTKMLIITPPKSAEQIAEEKLQAQRF